MSTRELEVGAGRSVITQGEDRRLLTVVCLLAAWPSVLWGFHGAGFLTDDWAVWLVFDREGVGGALWTLAFEQPARPVAAPYYAFVYLVIAGHTLLHALLMAAINAALMVSAWLVGRELVPQPILWPALMMFALLPNRATTRLWFVVGTYPLALALVLLGLFLLIRGRPAPAAALLVVSTLLYEGAVTFAVLVVALWVLGDLRGRLTHGAVVAMPSVVVAAASFLMSPKRGGGGPDVFENASTFLPGQIGVGIWHESVIARVAGGAVLLVVVVSIAKVFFPSFRADRPEYRWVIIGGCLAIAGALPFFVSGSIFGTSGVFDRINLIPSLGVALMFGAVWSLVRSWRPDLGAVAALLVLAWLAVANVSDVFDFRMAVLRGDQITTTLARLVEEGAPERLVVVPAQEDDGTGIAAFIYDGDLHGAMRNRYGGDWTGLTLVENTDCRALADEGGSVRAFNWEKGVIEEVAAHELDTRCSTWLA